MRKLMWFTIGFALACVIGVYFTHGNWTFLLFLFSALGAVGAFCVKSKASRISSVVLLGIAIGTFWLWLYDVLYLSPARKLDGEIIEASVEITDYSALNSPAEGKLHVDGKTYRVILYLYDQGDLSPGDVVLGSFRMRFTADGGQKEPTYHQGKGIFLLAYSQNDVKVMHAGSVPDKYLTAQLRNRIFHTIDSIFPDDVEGFARALLLGDRSKLSYETNAAFSYSGIAHVIAVSGMHVSILFSLLYNLCGKRRWFTALLGIPILIIFASLAGFTPSITRACIMQLLMILALLLNKEYDPPTALAFAVLTMLAANPLTITSVSFQLSVGCMIGIFLLSGRIHDYFMSPKRLGPAKGKSLKSRLIRWSVGSLSVTLGAMVFTMPLCAYYFGTISVVGIITNLLALWVISAVFYGIMLGCLLGWVWFPLGKIVAWIVAWPIRYVIFIAKLLSKVPLGVIFVNSPYIVAWLVFAVVIFVTFLLAKRKRPVVFCLCLILGLLGSVLFVRLEPKNDDFRVSVLDVGQGQCILLQYDDQNYIVDCGGDGAKATADITSAELLSQGIRKLDGLIITHYDADHAAGAELLLSHIPAEKLYLPDADPEHKIRNSLNAQYGDRICWLDFGQILQTEDFPMTIISAAEESTGNDSSLCVLFQPEDYDILITGDRDIGGENTLLEQYPIPELELLVVGHHGSASSTGFELLQATSPAMAVISVGSDNDYGHPSKETLNRLSIVDCRVWRTDTDGTLIFRG
jgi:competence protein ComEC